MPIEQLERDLKILTKAFEQQSKRLRRVEVLARLSDTAQTFLDLEDTPEEYTGYATWIPVVNSSEDGLRWGLTEGSCVAFECGNPGWRGTGGNPSRVLIHETAFQLDADGDDRGSDAVDLQRTRSNDNEVASGDYSTILGGRDNRITDTGGASDYSSIGGGFANYLDDADDCHVQGSFNELYNDCYAIHVHGENIDVDDVSYGFFAGLGHVVSGTHASRNGSNLWCIGEGNDFVSNSNDYPTYDLQIGILNWQEGDCFLCFQEGESNNIYGVGSSGDTTLWTWQWGYANYAAHVNTNYMFGQGGRSYQPTENHYYDGRIVFSGDWPNEYPTASPPGAGAQKGSGFNQDSWFSQNDYITDWAAAAAWTTSRFEFPIIQDSIWGFLAYIVGTELGCANSYMWKIEGLVENDGGTTTILGSAVTNIYRDVATKEWQVVADDANDRLVFQYRDTAGADATDCNIQLSLLTMEVGFET